VVDVGLWLPTKVVVYFFGSALATAEVYANYIEEAIREHIREHGL